MKLYDMVNRVLIFILSVTFFTSCKTQEVVKTQVISDTLIRHEVKEITLPVKNVTIIENPCKGDTLKPISQIVKSDHSTITIKEKDGDLVIEQNIDSIVNSKVEEIRKHLKKEKEIITVTKTKIPKWSWWLLGLTSLYVVYRVLRFKIPFLRILPI